MKDIVVLRDPEIIRIVVEDTRVKILNILRIRPMTISEMARALGKNVSTIYRHIKKLEALGLVEVVGERRTGHQPEKIYGRTATTFLLAPESMMENRALSEFTRVIMDEVFHALKSMGYSVNERRKVEMLFHRLHTRAVSRFDTFDENLSWNALWRLFPLLFLLEAEEEEIREIRSLITPP